MDRDMLNAFEHLATRDEMVRKPRLFDEAQMQRFLAICENVSELMHLCRETPLSPVLVKTNNELVRLLCEVTEIGEPLPESDKKRAG